MPKGDDQDTVQGKREIDSVGSQFTMAMQNPPSDRGSPPPAEHLIADQQLGFQYLMRQIRAITALPQERRTGATLQNRHNILRDSWERCIVTHGMICRQVAREVRNSIPYFDNDEYAHAEQAYLDTTDLIMEELDALSTHLNPLDQRSFSTSSPGVGEGLNHRGQAEQHSRIKLPRISIPKFSGGFTDWQPFKDAFESLVKSNPCLNNLEKLTFLKDSVQGDAFDLLCNINLLGTNFDVAWTMLSTQYENKRAIVTSHLNAIFALTPLKGESAARLLDLRNTVKRNLAALENLGRPVAHYSDIMVNRVVELLDARTQRDWELSLASTVECPNYEELDGFLLARIRALESLSIVSSDSKLAQSPKKAVDKGTPSHVKSHVVSSASPVCPICGNAHKLYQCLKFKQKSVTQRYDFVKTQTICINCLSSTHKYTNCPSTYSCSKCGRKHHSLLHRENATAVAKKSGPERERSDQLSELPVVDASLVQTHFSISAQIKPARVLLATAQVWIRSQSHRSVRVRALLDQGSTWTFISQDLAKTLNAKLIRVSATLSGLGGSEAGTSRHSAKITISPNLQGELAYETCALVLPTITSYSSTHQLPIDRWPHLRDLRLADDPTSHDPIQMLIGADLYGALILDGVRKGKIGDPVAQNSVFGWILSGRIDAAPTSDEPDVSVHHCTTNNGLDSGLQKFWEIEEVPSSPPVSIEDELCEAHFQNTHSRAHDGRYVVSLPFISDKPINIGLSRHIAERSLARIESRLAKNPSHQALYSDFMLDYEKSEHMHASEPASLPSTQVVYLPHHPVFRDDSLTTKLRVVFNASSKTSNGSSLNDHLMTGPKLQSDLPSVLTQWRSYRFVYSADIAKMYRQIIVAPEDRDYQRILWRSSPDVDVRDYRLKTVTYGTRSAPFLALRVLKQLIQDEGAVFPRASQVLEHDTFVDDILFGAPSKDDAQYIRNEVIALLDKAKLEPRKWASNATELLNSISPANHGLAWDAPLSETDGIKVLGVSWSPVSDTFRYNIRLPILATFTKRSALSLLARFYDPVGWVAPVIVTGKIMLQHLWKKQYQWDDELPEDLAFAWSIYFQALPELHKVSLPRWTCHAPDVLHDELHGFADASEAAYGAVIYLRVVTASGKIAVTLLASKTKVAPVKQLSIPRLELQAALLLSRLLVALRDVRSLADLPYQCWTDSSIVLAWLAKQAATWKTFVANRVSEIQTLVPAGRWRHVRSESNPADLASRGSTVSELLDSGLWWNGPSWLMAAPAFWPDASPQVADNLDFEEKINTHVAYDSVHPDIQAFASRYSSWIKLLRVTATMFRFINVCRTRIRLRSDTLDALCQDWKPDQALSASELDAARSLWFKLLQAFQFAPEIFALQHGTSVSSKSRLAALSPFLDESGLLRVGGRLAHSEVPFSAKHPIVLSNHFVIKLLIRWMHSECHHGGVQVTLSSLRQTLWVLNARRLVKSVVFNCVQCAKLRAQIATQLMADLPRRRVTRPDRAFSDSGVDYAGPLQVRLMSGRGHRAHPCYIAVFVCFATKAIHLEAVTEYTSAAFIAAFQRFVSRRGLPSRLNSDCGTNFQGANRELKAAFATAVSDSSFQALLAKDNVQWRFLPPAAPHFGGLWEAGVRSVKFHLKRILATHTPTYEELSTLLCQIEAVLNSRPLGPLTDSIDDLAPLTPGHFLIGGPLNAIPHPSLCEIPVSRLSRWQQMQHLLELFWKRWRQDYLQSLQQRTKWRFTQRPIEVGQVVLLRKPNLPPTKWALGRVLACHPGSDGLVRVVKIKTATSTFLRPISELALLPIDLESPCVETQDDTPDKRDEALLN